MSLVDFLLYDLFDFSIIGFDAPSVCFIFASVLLVSSKGATLPEVFSNEFDETLEIEGLVILFCSWP